MGINLEGCTMVIVRPKCPGATRPSHITDTFDETVVIQNCFVIYVNSSFMFMQIWNSENEKSRIALDTFIDKKIIIKYFNLILKRIIYVLL